MVSQPNDSRTFVLLKMRFRRIPHGFVQLAHGICLGENAHAKGACSITALMGFFYQKDQLLHTFLN